MKMSIFRAFVATSVLCLAGTASADSYREVWSCELKDGDALVGAKLRLKGRRSRLWSRAGLGVSHELSGDNLDVLRRVLRGFASFGCLDEAERPPGPPVLLAWGTWKKRLRVVTGPISTGSKRMS